MSVQYCFKHLTSWSFVQHFITLYIYMHIIFIFISQINVFHLYYILNLPTQMLFFL